MASLTVYGNLVYAACSYGGLVISDASDPSNIRFTGRYTPGDVQRVAVSGNTAFVSGSFGCRILDVANPSAPTDRGAFPLRSPTISGNFAYGMSNSMFLAFDISVPTAPMLVAKVPGGPLPYISPIEVSGDRAVVRTQFGFVVYDISDPRNPRRAGLWGPGPPFSQLVSQDIALSGTDAFISFNGGILFIVGIADADAPTLRGSYSSGPQMDISIDPSGDYVYLADYLVTMQVVDVRDRTRPKFIKSIGSGAAEGISDVAQNGRVFIAGSGGFQAINVTVPAEPVKEGKFLTDGASVAIAVAGNRGYVADSGAGLAVLDISDVKSPQLLSVAPAAIARDVKVIGDHAYVASDINGMQIYDVSNPSAPGRIGSYAGRYMSVAVEGNYALVVDFRTDLNATKPALHVIDVSNPAAPTRVGHLIYGNQTSERSAIVLSGNIALVMHETPDDSGNWANSKTLRIIDVADKTSPRLLHDAIRSRGTGIAFFGKYAYVSDNFGLRVLDLTIPASPQVVGSYLGEPGCYPISIVLAGNYACISWSEGDVLVIDVSDPSSPRPLARIPSPSSYRSFTGSSSGLHFDGQHLYVANAENGIEIWRLLTLEARGAGQLRIHAPAGASGKIQYSSDVKAAPWIDLQAFTVENSSLDFTDPNPVDEKARFYRLSIP